MLCARSRLGGVDWKIQKRHRRVISPGAKLPLAQVLQNRIQIWLVLHKVPIRLTAHDCTSFLTADCQLDPTRITLARCCRKQPTVLGTLMDGKSAWTLSSQPITAKFA